VWFKDAMAREPKPKPEKAPPPDPFGGITPEEYHVVQAGEIWQYDDTGHDLSLEERLFVRSYVIDRNPVAALRRLNYDGDTGRIKRMADKYLAKSEVQDAIEHLAHRMMEHLEIDALRIQRRLAAVAFFDPREVLQFDHTGVRLINSKFWNEHQAAAIAGVEMGQNGIKLKFYDSLRATEMLAKQTGLQADDTDAAAAAAKAAATAAVQKIMDIFERTVPDDGSDAVNPALPNPFEQGGPETVQ